jgi:MoaA/NifB/PqqE/SkfB family radical SAM enzyme
MLKTAMSLKKGAKKRECNEKRGTHIPPFLIASVVSNCNLTCAGCYARANGSCNNGRQTDGMTTAAWRRVFKQTARTGISFVLIAGGEPLLKKDIIKAAASCKSTLFPVFTNGTLINDDYIKLFDKNRNIIPILSIEGDAVRTDKRRGAGVADRIETVMAKFKEKNILFGTSITVTTENQMQVTQKKFAAELREKGCGLVFYVEYVPAEKNSDHLALSQAELKTLQTRIDSLRADDLFDDTILLSFPGDEERMGGCLAAGRGFFHINPDGGAEPCPFSPFSELHVTQHSLAEIANSQFFASVREIGAADAAMHHGGCALFAHKDEVRDILNKDKSATSE